MSTHYREISRAQHAVEEAEHALGCATDAMTENEIRANIRELESVAEKGDLTPRDATRLAELRIALRKIRRAKNPNALIW